ncbi:MAG TPA: lysine--tRNA ligase [Candidatus Limnocylindria bacterium]|nr:lysine--tRNA ligase [Candidatus Limnocylindria bacterium]
MSLPELMRQRREKLAVWRADGDDPYAYRFEVTAHAAELLARGDQVTTEPGERVRVAGRVMTLRGHGKAGFAHLLDGTGSIQIYFRADQLDERFRRYQRLDVGDWIGVAGPLFRTKTGEITIRAEDLELLAKALRPLPEKWHGLRDTETRFRQRYADLFMNLEVREIFRRRARLISGMREFLEARDYLEVETPVLQPLYGGAFAQPFVTHHNALDLDLYLRISNELYLKRLIVGGFERVFEFSRDFRNEGMDRTHSPEFTMLEFYQAFADVHDMMALTEALVVHAVECATGSTTLVYQGQPLDFTPPWPRVSLLDAVSDKVGERVHALDAAQLGRLAARHQLEFQPGSGAGALLDELFSALVQPELVRPTFVVDHPREISPLARAKRDQPDVVERFEIVAAGMELANAFSEQNDPEAQARAFEDQQQRREAGELETQVTDRDYLRALEYGMPPTGGVGIGIDRMAMLVCDARSIRDVILFPPLRPEEGRPAEEEEEEVAADPEGEERATAEGMPPR